MKHSDQKAAEWIIGRYQLSLNASLPIIVLISLIKVRLSMDNCLMKHSIPKAEKEMIITKCFATIGKKDSFTISMDESQWHFQIQIWNEIMGRFLASFYFCLFNAVDSF